VVLRKHNVQYMSGTTSAHAVQVEGMTAVRQLIARTSIHQRIHQLEVESLP
jgi:hypothetical protein